MTTMHAVAPGLWVWRTLHPHWKPGDDYLDTSPTLTVAAFEQALDRPP